MSDNNESIRKLRKILDDLERDVKEAKKALFDIEQIVKKDYKEVPGIEGTFDGFYLIASDGSKYEVAANYAAKSRLAYGDTLKLIEEDGKQIFKQIAKVPRKKVEAVVNKKEGKWYALAETGSYRLSDAAATFHNLNVQDKITIVIPEDNINAPFAALEKAPENIKKLENVASENVQSSSRSREVPATKKAEHKSDSKTTGKASTKPKKPLKKEKTESKDTKEKKEYVEQISGSGTFTLGDDDLR